MNSKDKILNDNPIQYIFQTEWIKDPMERTVHNWGGTTGLMTSLILVFPLLCKLRGIFLNYPWLKWKHAP